MYMEREREGEREREEGQNKVEKTLESQNAHMFRLQTKNSWPASSHMVKSKWSRASFKQAAEGK